MNGNPTQENLDAQASARALSDFKHDGHEQWIYSYPFVGTMPAFRRRSRLLTLQEAKIIAKHYRDLNSDENGEIRPTMTVHEATSLLNAKRHNNYETWQVQSGRYGGFSVRGPSNDPYTEFDVIAMAEKVRREDRS